MTRDKPGTDPNNDWNPVATWTNTQPLKSFMLKEDNWKDALLNSGNGKIAALFSAERDVFAHQLVSVPATGNSDPKPKNDAPIFSSSTGLLKAIEHEKGALPSRMKKDRLYFFIPVTFVDADMVEVAYNTPAPTVIEIEQISELTQFIVGKRDVSSIMHFVSKTRLNNFVSELDEAFASLKQHVSDMLIASYNAILTDKNVRDCFADEFSKRFSWYVLRRAKDLGLGEDITIDGFDVEDGKLLIYVNSWGHGLDLIQQDEKLKETVAEWLAKEARYSGHFEFDSGIPF